MKTIDETDRERFRTWTNFKFSALIPLMSAWHITGRSGSYVWNSVL